jgi:hypothetical protein
MSIGCLIIMEMSLVSDMCDAYAVGGTKQTPGDKIAFHYQGSYYPISFLLISLCS